MDRRNFLTKSVIATAGLAVGNSIPSFASGFINTSEANTIGASEGHHPLFKLGMGGSPLGNASSIAITDTEAQAVLENAWNSGVRYYDTAPFYGFTKSERRLGHLLSEKNRDEFVISTKVGRIFTAAANPRKSAWANPAPFDFRYDYTAQGVRRSLEDSLQRLGISSIDFVFIHDLSPDNGDMKENWTQYFDQALKGAMSELTRMREEGIIKGWGMGVNSLEPLYRVLKESNPDILLTACNYTLIDHEEALNTLFPLCEEKNVSLVIGSPLNNGFLAGKNRFNYAGDRKPNAAQIEKRNKLTAVADKYNIELRTAALQFCAAPKVVASVIPGARAPHQAGENLASMSVKIPGDFWKELKSQNLIADNAPVPNG